MAQKIQAINAFRPRIEQGNTVQKAEFIRAVSRATSLVEGTVDLSIKETRDQIIEYCRAGRAVKLEGFGTFTPSMDLNGVFTMSFRPDSAFANGLNMPGTFNGNIINRENIGKTSNELVTRWNEEFPEDMVETPAS